jgi:hypothetical protein
MALAGACVMTNSRPIIGKNLYGALLKAGFASENTRRVVIDIPVNDIPVVYTETFGNAGIIEIIEAVSEVEVKLKSATEEVIDGASGKHSE